MLHFCSSEILSYSTLIERHSRSISFHLKQREKKPQSSLWKHNSWASGIRFQEPFWHLLVLVGNKMLILSMKSLLINLTRMIMDPEIILQMHQILKYKTDILRVLAFRYIWVRTWQRERQREKKLNWTIFCLSQENSMPSNSHGTVLGQLTLKLNLWSFYVTFNWTLLDGFTTVIAL